MRTKQLFYEWSEKGLFNSEGTKKKYISAFRKFANENEATLENIQTYINENLTNKSMSTKNVFISAVKHFVEFVRVTYNHTYFNVRDIKLFRGSTVSKNQPLDDFTVGQVKDLLHENKYLYKKERFIIAALLTTGVRSEQLSKNDWNELLHKDFIIIKGKGEKERKIFSNDFIRRNLPVKGPINYDQISKVCKKVKDLVQWEGQLTAHTWRYTYATQIFNRGGWDAAPYLQKLLGHSTIDQTIEYINLSDDDLKMINDLQFVDKIDAIANLSLKEQNLALKKELVKQKQIIDDMKIKECTRSHIITSGTTKGSA